MIDWGQFHFLRPIWLLALAVLALVIGQMLRRRLGAGSWRALCDAQLMPHVLMGKPVRRSRWPVAVLALCGTLAILAMAGPTWSRLPQPVFSARSALVIALDLSRSMDAGDVTPSRLSRARFKMADLLNRRAEGQTALLVYTGDAFTVCPLTDDGGTILAQLPSLSTDIMPVHGSRADLALRRAGDLLRQAGFSRGDILLVGDDVDEARAGPVARDLRSQGYRVSVMGVGTPDGAPVPLADGSFLKDENGQIVVPTLEEASMRQLAGDGGGEYVRLVLDDSDLNRLSRLFATLPESGVVKDTGLKTDTWEDQGPWLLLLILPLAALAFRRGVLIALAVVLIPVPRPASAFEWSSLWQRDDQRAKQALDAGDAKRAAGLFQDPDWKGVAQYRAGQFDAAARSLSNGRHGDARRAYNRGNALARLGRYQEAVSAYEEALRQDPGDADARYNKSLVEKELQKQQRQQPGGKGSRSRQENGSPRPGQGRQQDGRGSTDRKDARAGHQEGTGQPRQDAAGSRQPAQGNRQAGQGNGEQQAQREASRKPGQARGTPGQEPGKDKTGKQQGTQIAKSDDARPDEQEQATEQWLRRIPDDPGGLLRRKFLYQYQQRYSGNDPGDQKW